MARLPRVSRETAVTPQIQSTVSAAEIASPYRMIAEALAGAGGELVAGATERAGREGAGAVTRLPDGTLAVDFRSDYSEIGRAYNRSAAQAYMARLSGDVRDRASAIALESRGDPEFFDGAWTAFRQQVAKNAPDIMRGGVETLLDEVGGQQRRGVIMQKFNLDIADFKSRISTELDALDDELATMARNGGAGTDDYQKAAARFRDLIAELTANPEFGVSDEEAAIRLKRAESRWTAEGIVGSIDRTWRGKGMAEAEAEARRLLWDDKLALSPDERRTYVSRALEYLSASDADRKVQLKAAQDQAAELAKMLDADARLVDDEVVDTAIRNLAALGDPAKAIELSKKRAGARFLGGTFAEAGNQGQVDLYRRMFTPPGEAAPAGSIVDRIIGIESGGNPAARNPRSSALGLGQFTAGTWIETIRRHQPHLLEGRSRAEVLALRTDPALARLMTAQLAADNALFLTRRGLPATAGAIYLAHFAGAGGAAALLSADPNATAASVLGRAAVDANPFLKGMTAADVIAWAERKMSGQGGGTYAYTPAYDPAVVKAMRAEITTDFRGHWEDIKKGVAMGLPPSAGEMGLLADQLDIVDDPNLRKEVADFFESHASGYLLSEMAPADAEAFLTRLRSDADGYSAGQVAAIKAAEDAAKAQREALSSDPIGYAVGRQIAPPPPALDLTSPESVTAGMAARQRIASLVDQRFRTGPVSALRREEGRALAAWWDGADTNQKLGLLGAMAGTLDQPTLMATLATLAEKADTQGLAIAGALAATNPEAAASVVRGQAALAANPAFAYSTSTQEYRDAVQDYFPATTLAPGLEGAWAAHLDTARAAYADMAARAGDASGKFSPDRWRQAVDLVTGGFVEFNGRRIVTPRSDIGQERFDEVVAGLPEEAFAGALTPDGTPVTADFVRRLGRLQSYGDGRYVIDLGDTGVYALTSPGAAPVPGGVPAGSFLPFVLDLRPWLDRTPTLLDETPVADPLAIDRKSAFEAYQKATGAGNTAPPGLR